MKLICVACAALCVLAVLVSGAEEPADPSITSADVKESNVDDHGPLMKHLHSSGEGTTALHRQKRTYTGDGGGCCSKCGDCGGGGRGGSQSHSTASAQASASSSSGSGGGGHYH